MLSIGPSGTTLSDISITVPKNFFQLHFEMSSEIMLPFCFVLHIDEIFWHDSYLIDNSSLHNIYINKISFKIWRKKCWFRGRFVLFLAKIHSANAMTPELLEKCGEQVNITIGFNVDNVIFKMGIIILASQSVLAVFICKIVCAKTWKTQHQWERY